MEQTSFRNMPTLKQKCNCSFRRVLVTNWDLLIGIAVFEYDLSYARFEHCIQYSPVILSNRQNYQSDSQKLRFGFG